MIYKQMAISSCGPLEECINHSRIFYLLVGIWADELMGRED